MKYVGYKFRLYPNKKQKQMLSKTFGCCRFVYNYYLTERINSYKDNGVSLSYYDNANNLTSLKEEYEWLREVDNSALQSALRNLDSAYQHFFKQKFGFPKYKSKKSHKYSYTTTYTTNNIRFRGSYIKIPKLGYIKIRNKHKPQGNVLRATITQEPSGRYYVSVCCKDVNTPQLQKTNKQIGIDMGIKDFCTLSNGIIIPNPSYLKQSLNKLAKLQKQLSRKTKGSSNRNKARIKVARLYEHITNQRIDFLHKLSLSLVKEYDLIAIEDLDVKSMLQKKQSTNNHSKRVHRATADVSWSEFVRQLQYKSEWYGKKAIKIDQYYPSSQICSCCGYKNPIIKDLAIREWECPNCHTMHNRDINASKNILAEAQRQLMKVG